MDRVLTSSEEVSCGGRLADVNVGSDGVGRVLLLNVRKHRYMLPADLIAIPRIFNPDICLKLKSFFLCIKPLPAIKIVSVPSLTNINISSLIYIGLSMAGQFYNYSALFSLHSVVYLRLLLHTGSMKQIYCTFFFVI